MFSRQWIHLGDPTYNKPSTRDEQLTKPSVATTNMALSIRGGVRRIRYILHAYAIELEAAGNGGESGQAFIEHPD